jgi:hypothetical protein
MDGFAVAGGLENLGGQDRHRFRIIQLQAAGAPFPG